MRIPLHLPLLVLAAWHIEANPVEIYKRIKNGRNCGADEALHQVLLIRRVSAYEIKICGGSLLFSKWVLTAAHCYSSNIEVYIGSHDKNLRKDPIPIKQLYVHPDYEKNKKHYDIMLIELEKDAPDVAKPVHLPTDCDNKKPPADMETTELLISGWGKTEGTHVPHLLQCAKVKKVVCPQMGDEEENSIEVQRENRKKVLCTEDRTGCGDSGGGLVLEARNMVYGVVSSDCSNVIDKASRYASVCYHLQWIKDVLNK